MRKWAKAWRTCLLYSSLVSEVRSLVLNLQQPAGWGGVKWGGGTSLLTAHTDPPARAPAHPRSHPQLINSTQIYPFHSSQLTAAAGRFTYHSLGGEGWSYGLGVGSYAVLDQLDWLDRLLTSRFNPILLTRLASLQLMLSYVAHPPTHPPNSFLDEKDCRNTE